MKSMLSNTNRFFVITGGPGSGKSSLIDALEIRGYGRSIEAGRAVIQDQSLIGGHALPWDDRLLFSELMLGWEMRSYRIAEQQDGIVFFDRGVVDIVGYLQLIHETVPDHVRKATEMFRYNNKVFIAPLWPEIFQQDRERKQDFREAVRTYHALAEAYQACDYELIELPRSPVEQRVEFVLRHVGTASE